ncbi:MAG: serine/threonine-protein kinase [Myxococcota bacterium]
MGLEKYTVVGVLGENAVAQVLAAKVRGELDRWAVIKRPWPTVIALSSDGLAFVHEMNRVARLAHDNICSVIDAGFDSTDGAYFATPYYPGETFAEVISRFTSFGRIMRAELAAYIAAGVSDALEYAYAFRGPSGRPEHVVHGNLNPENVLVTYAGTVKIQDLGLEAALPIDRVKSALTGTELAYSSPERARGDGMSHAGDLFSLGVLLWEAMSGRPLFRGRDASHTKDLLRECRAQPIREINPDVPADFAAMLNRLVAKSPSDRYPNAYELGRDLRRFLAARAPTLGPSELGRIMRESFVERSHLLDPTERLVPGAIVALPRRMDELQRQIESEAPTEDLPRQVQVRPSWNTRLVVEDEDEPASAEQPIPMDRAVASLPPEASTEPNSLLRASQILDLGLQAPDMIDEAPPPAQVPAPRTPSFSKVYSEPTIPRRSLTPTTSEVPSARAALGPPATIPLALTSGARDPAMGARPMEAAWASGGSEPIELRGVQPWWQSWQALVGLAVVGVAVGIIGLTSGNVAPHTEPLAEQAHPITPTPSPERPRPTPEPVSPPPANIAALGGESPSPTPAESAAPTPAETAAPRPSATPSPEPTRAAPEPSRAAVVSASPSASPLPSSAPRPRPPVERSPAPSASAAPEPTASAQPSASPSPTQSPVASASPSASPSSTPAPSAAPEDEDDDMNLGASLARDGAQALEKGDLARAERLIYDCLEFGGRPECHRLLGRLKEAKGDPSGAVVAYQHYLKAAPRAADRAAIEARITALSAP